MRGKHRQRVRLIFLFGACYWTAASAGAADQLITTDGTPTVSVHASVEVQENLYARWTPVNRVYKGWQLISNLQERDPDVYPNATVSVGNAFGSEPAKGSFMGQEPVTGFEGQRLINTKLRNLGTFTGEMRSDVFEIKGAVIDFLIGGGRYKNRTCVKLFVQESSGFHQVRSATGENNVHLIRKQWNVSEYLGRKAYLEALT